MQITTTPASISPSQPPSISRVPEKQLNQSDFLKILTIQLAKQDPLKPIDDQSFIAQMAQFSTLQQTSELSKSVAALRSAQELGAASTLIGKTVTVTDENQAEVMGVVYGVDTSEAAPRLVVDGKRYTMNSLKYISKAPPPS